MRYSRPLRETISAVTTNSVAHLESAAYFRESPDQSLYERFKTYRVSQSVEPHVRNRASMLYRAPPLLGTSHSHKSPNNANSNNSQVSTALVMRKPTFLARKEWKTVPWSAKGRSKDVMELLLEQVVDLPAVLWRYDRYNIALQTPSTLPSERYLLLSRVWSAVSRVEAGLRRWKRDWADTYIFGRPSEVEYQGAGFPVFQYQDPITQRIITPRTIIYPDPQLARTLGMYYAAMVMLSSVDTRPVGAITAAERLEFAHLICRSMEYYIRTVPGNMINRMAFPLRVAYDSLPERSLERRYIEEVFRLVARRNALRAWGKYIPDISPKV